MIGEAAEAFVIGQLEAGCRISDQTVGNILKLHSLGLDFTSMHPLYTPEVAQPFADAAFKRMFGVSLDDFDLDLN